ncbi:GAF domain-containing sensor histidine kinase [Salarchaeum sp. JOR-1]|uniref:GAF domain-containing sensor histidine kinase n=1 Tax=Salarchaeum sp. JOR-1 TaxID=2599399 RepID=UPI0011985A41|nr:GAF domain-containing protein [Salarchaeum sp. JOR-1]QDX39548.1 PAS domain S-box protein [Salarchaeum sp. JOR-1]
MGLPRVVAFAPRDRRNALADALTSYDATVVSDADAARDALAPDVHAVVCRADADGEWKRVLTAAPAIESFVLTDGDPAPDDVTAANATPVYAGDGWDWADALTAALPDTANGTSDDYARFIEQAPVPIVVTDANGVVRRANAATAGLFGYDDPARIEGNDATTPIHPADRDEARERLERVLEECVTVPTTALTFTDLDDNPVRVLAASAPATLDGEPAVRTILLPDESYETRRELAESREKIAAIHEVAVDLETATTVSEVCERAVRAAEDILEFDLSVIDSVRDGRFEVEYTSEKLPEDDLAHMPSDAGLLGTAYQTGETIVTDRVSESADADPQGPYESALSVPMGEWGAFQAVAVEPAAFDESDEELAEILVSHAHVAVERIERQQDLRERERAFSALHDATREMANANTEREVLERAVDAAVETLEMPLAGAFRHDPDNGCLRPAVVTDKGQDVVGDHAPLRKGESLAYDVFTSGEPGVYNDLGATDGRANPDTSLGSELILPLGDVGVLLFGSQERDAFDDVAVTTGRVLAANTTTVLDRVAREQEVAAERERLDEFASIVAHDLRNPLNTASGFLELARETEGDEPLERVEDALERMDHLIEDVLTLARQGTLAGDQTAVALVDAARDAWQVTPGGAGTLTARDESLAVLADRERLVELLGNLFENAKTHVGGDVTVTVGELDDGQGFFVADDGSGVHASKRDQVFSHGYSTSDAGTGFGLSIVESIAEAHGWRVNLTESESGGARFEFRGVTSTASPSGA